jgi:hypothetical protein
MTEHMIGCERCGYRGWVYHLRDNRLAGGIGTFCSACWDVKASEFAIADGKRKVDQHKRRVAPVPVRVGGLER